MTPPGSSDTGSSGSGQSPTSTHPGSPPTAIQGAPKRPGYYELVDGTQAKRQRISHYKKPTDSHPPAESVIENTFQDDYDFSIPSRNRQNGDSYNRLIEDDRHKKYEDKSVVKNHKSINASDNYFIKRSNSPADVTSSQPQADSLKKKTENFPDTRPSYKSDSDTIQENTVSNSQISEPSSDYKL